MQEKHKTVSSSNSEFLKGDKFQRPKLRTIPSASQITLTYMQNKSSWRDRASLGFDYWEHRISKLQKQKPEWSIYGKLGFLRNQKNPKQIFKGVNLLINGRTGTDIYSQFHLAKLARLHGANVLPFFAKKKLTHVVCRNLSGSKTERAQKDLMGRYAVKYVAPEWIIDSIKAGVKLPEAKYLIIKEKSQSITKYFAKVEE